MSTREAVIVDAVRTPVGKRGGLLSGWHPADLLAQTIATLIQRTGTDTAQVADVIAGCVIQTGEQAGNIGRWAALGAGLPESVPAVTIDRQCGSGQQAVHFAAQGVRSGEYDFAVGCGVESMSRVDLGPLFDPGAGLGPWYGQRALDRFGGNLRAQGPSAELVADKWDLGRTELDAFSMESHRRAHAATERGCFAGHLVPVTTPEGMMIRDEGIRASADPGKIAGLKPVFRPDGVITAANSSQVSDGAAAVLVADRSAAENAGFRPKAVIRSMAACADDPVLQFTAVIPAARKALDQVGLSIADMDRIEVNGGSIAVGHPLGSTGARLITDLVHELRQCGGRFGLVVICEGGGMANATVIERL